MFYVLDIARTFPAQEREKNADSAMCYALRDTVVLGGFRGAKVTKAAGEAGRATQTVRAAGRTHDLAPVIATIEAAGTTSHGGVAAALNARGIPAARGGAWSATQVRRVLAPARQAV